MDLTGKLYVVAGGTGAAGSAVTLGLLKHGATVAVTSRSDQRARAFLKTLDAPNAHLFTGEMSELASAQVVRSQITSSLGDIDGVVASLGGWWEGPPLTQLKQEVWQHLLADNLTSHFVAARTFMPALIGRPQSVYVMLGGVGAVLSLPHAGPISVTGAAQTRLLEVLAAEETGVRLHEVRVMAPITSVQQSTSASADAISADVVGDYLARVVAPDFLHSDDLVLHVPELT